MKHYTEKQKQQVIKLRKLGHTHQYIADMVGIRNLTTVRNICGEAGFAKKQYKEKIQYDVGQRYDNFVLIEKVAPKILKCGNNTSRWRCLCDCGRTFVITTKQIYRGQKSCGCLSPTSTLHIQNSQEVVGNARYNTYKTSANNRKLEWQLSKDQFIQLLFANCHYCNSEPLTPATTTKHTVMVNGIDRVDNNIGYVASNCVACCKFCNRAKGSMSIEEWTSWLLRVKNKK